MFAAGAAGRRRRAAAARRSRAARPGVGGEPLGVLPRLRPVAAAGDRLAGGARARRRTARDGRRGGVGLDRRARPRLVRPPDHREHPAGLRAARDPPPRGVERGDLRRALGRAGRSARREAAAGGRPRALGGLPRSFERLVDLLRDGERGSTASRRRRSPSSSGDVHTTYVAEVDLGERRGLEPRLPDRLLAVPQPALAAAAPRGQGDGLASRRSRLLAARPCSAASPRPSASLALRRRARRSTTRSASSRSTSRRRRVTIFRALPDDATGDQLEPLYTHSL